MDKMGEIILHPSHPDYCKECIYYGRSNGGCQNEEYIKNAYKVICIWKYCKYKRKRRGYEEEDNEVNVVVLLRLQYELEQIYTVRQGA